MSKATQTEFIWICLEKSTGAPAPELGVITIFRQRRNFYTSQGKAIILVIRCVKPGPTNATSCIRYKFQLYLIFFGKVSAKKAHHRQHTAVAIRSWIARRLCIMQKLLKAAINYAKYAAYVAKFMAVISSRLVDDVLGCCVHIFSLAWLFFRSLSSLPTRQVVSSRFTSSFHQYGSLTVPSTFLYLTTINWDYFLLTLEPTFSPDLWGLSQREKLLLAFLLSPKSVLEVQGAVLFHGSEAKDQPGNTSY